MWNRDIGIVYTTYRLLYTLIYKVCLHEKFSIENFQPERVEILPREHVLAIITGENFAIGTSAHHFFTRFTLSARDPILAPCQSETSRIHVRKNVRGLLVRAQ